MRITILTVGSRGDVQPLLGFGAGLDAAGHEVRFAAFPHFEAQVQAVGLDFATLAEGKVSAGQASAQFGQQLGRRARRPALLDLITDARSVARERLADAMDACEGADAIVTNELAVLLGWQASERFGAQLVRARLCPPPRMAGRHGAGVVRQAAWLLMRRWLGPARRDAGLPPLPLREPLGGFAARRTLELRAYSPAVVSHAEQPGRWTRVTGYWFLDGQFDSEPPPDLVEFLAAGSPPVCVNFGSMFVADAAASTTALVVGALHDAGQRGILIRGLDGFGDGHLPPDMLAVGAVEHYWLFQRCSAVVHHGGAGTTAAALRAGLPSVVVPHMMDQYAWGRTIHELGAGPAPIRRRKLSKKSLARAITVAVADTTMRERAEEIGGRIGAEEGIANAVEALERHLQYAGEPSVLDATKAKTRR